MFNLRLEFPAYPAVSVPVIDLRSDTTRPMVYQRAALLVPQMTVYLSVRTMTAAPLLVDQTKLRQ